MDQSTIAVLLKPFRERIDALDDELVALLGKRFGIISEVATLKKQHGIPAILPDRVEQVKLRAIEKGRAYNLDPDFMRALYTQIIDHACEMEEDIKTGGK